MVSRGEDLPQGGETQPGQNRQHRRSNRQLRRRSHCSNPWERPRSRHCRNRRQGTPHRWRRAYRPRNPWETLERGPGAGNSGTIKGIEKI